MSPYKNITQLLTVFPHTGHFILITHLFCSWKFVPLNHPHLFLLFLKINLFILFLFILFLASLGLRCCAWAFSSCGKWGLLFVAVCGLLIAVASLASEHGLQARGLQQLWLAGSRAQAQQLWHTGLVAPRHVGSSQIRARTRVPCIGRQVLNHCATREALALTYFFPFSTSLPSGDGLFVVCIYNSVSVLLRLFICFNFQIPHISEIIQYLSLSDLFHLV